jgi:hypothetical protein
MEFQTLLEEVWQDPWAQGLLNYILIQPDLLAQVPVGRNVLQVELSVHSDFRFSLGAPKVQVEEPGY